MGVSRCTTFLRPFQNTNQSFQLKVSIGRKEILARVDTASKFLVFHDGLLNDDEIGGLVTLIEDKTQKVLLAASQEDEEPREVELYDLPLSIGGRNFVMRAIFLPRAQHKHGLLGREIFRCFNLSVRRTSTGKCWRLHHDPLEDCRNFFEVTEEDLENLGIKVFTDPSDVEN